MGTPPEPVRLTADEAAAVLRRAVELDAATPAVAGDTVDLAVVEQVAAEVGVSPDAVRRAVAELRAGALAPRPAAPAPADQRVVPLPPAEALEQVGRILHRQLFELRRFDGRRALWRRRTDTPAGLRRSFDFGRHVKLSTIDAVVVTAAPLPDSGTTLVRVEAELVRIRRAARSAGAVPAGLAVAGGAGAAAVTGDAALVLAGGALAAAAGGLGLGLGRSWYRRHHAEAVELLGWLLDQVASGRPEVH